MSRFIPGNQKHLKLDDRKYRETLSSSRAGINLTKKELHQKDMIISPLILNGQSPYHILANHPELDMSVRTMYSYLDMGLFSARNIDLKRFENPCSSAMALRSIYSSIGSFRVEYFAIHSI